MVKKLSFTSALIRVSYSEPFVTPLYLSSMLVLTPSSLRLAARILHTSAALSIPLTLYCTIFLGTAKAEIRFKTPL